MPFIEDLCEGSSSWGPALSSLTLTGLQPCFEDLVLLGAVYVGALACLALESVPHTVRAQRIAGMGDNQ